MANLDAKEVLAGLTESNVQAVFQSLGVESFQANGPSNWIARSPLRPDDHRPSFSIRREGGVWHDKATNEGGSIYDAVMQARGCDFPASIEFVANIAGVTPSKPAHVQPSVKSHILEAYDYVCEDRRLGFQAVRYEPKDFRQRRPDGKGGWIYNLQGVRLVLYRLPEILDADPGRKVIIVEGEKDADRLAKLGLVATTNPMGAGKWRDEYNATLDGRYVVVLPDNDDPGRYHAENIARSLSGIAKSVKIVALPNVPPKGDVSDWLDAGGTVTDLRHLVQNTPEWTPEDAPSERPPQGPGLVLTSLADVVVTPTDWIWARRLARRKVHIMAGHPGDGKSTVATAKAAILSVAGMWPDDTRAPLGRSLFLLAEDSLEDTLKPRLDLHGADSSMVFALKAVREANGNESPFSMARHLPLLEQAIIEHRIDYLIIDPLTSFLPNSDRNAEGDVRDLLTPLSALADRTGVAVEAIMHVGKPSGTNRRPLQQILGATAFGAIARLVTMIAPTSDDPNDTHRVMAVVKSNLAIKPPALEFFRGEDEPITWVGESDLNIDELLSGVRSQPRVDAEGFLRDTLSDGPVSSIDVQLRAAGNGIAWRTIRRAADDVVGVIKFKQPGVTHGPWYWRLPDAKVSTDQQSGHLEDEPKVSTPIYTQVDTLHNESEYIPADDGFPLTPGKVSTQYQGGHVDQMGQGVQGVHLDNIEVDTLDPVIQELDAWRSSGHLSIVEDPIVVSPGQTVQPDSLPKYLKYMIAALAIAGHPERVDIERELRIVHREIRRQLEEQEAA